MPCKKPRIKRCMRMKAKSDKPQVSEASTSASAPQFYPSQVDDGDLKQKIGDRAVIKRKLDQILEELEDMNDSKKTLISISDISQLLFMELMESCGIVRRSIKPVVVASSKKVAAFSWRANPKEGPQSKSYLKWLEDNITLPKNVKFYNAASDVNLLFTTSLSTRYNFNGTTDTVIVPEENIVCKNVAGGLLVGMELKSYITPKGIIQAIVKLLVANIHSVHAVVMILTDLGSKWQFFWLEKGTVVDCRLDLPQAITLLESIL
ncbi:hypothetical protein BC936DRAFT_145196 [Jimgerdemannia flammicorona]|uniref:Uncharacterized protein n=1 Tax=Jimgerdemannia flammicorona TaxID=994334 RepID=A0A433DAQ7_9FUNG|nr:hypothetical protein BC936DRAFT_145196 [Jimgerdemannia flammicorona]